MLKNMQETPFIDYEHVIAVTCKGFSNMLKAPLNKIQAEVIDL
jgi:hypothetical protein